MINREFDRKTSANFKAQKSLNSGRSSRSSIRVSRRVGEGSCRKAWASSGVGMTPIVSRKARRTNSSSVQGSDGAIRIRFSLAMTASSTRLSLGTSISAKPGTSTRCVNRTVATRL